MSLCACAANGERPVAYQVSNARVPAVYLEPTPAPAIPAEGEVTDVNLAILGQNDEKALEACNADKAKIEKILSKNSK